MNLTDNNLEIACGCMAWSKCRSALEASRKEAQAAADRAEERASANATELSKCYQIIEKLQAWRELSSIHFLNRFIQGHV